MDDPIVILKALGYPIRRVGETLTTRAVYRDGDNQNSITIYEKSSSYYDWVKKDGGSLRKLVQLTLKLDSEDKIDEWLKTNNFELKKVDPKPEIKSPRIYSADLLKKIIPKHDYWYSRGISKETLQPFLSGIAVGKGLLSNRYVFPIFNARKQIVGFAGRATGESKSKWILVGDKKFWAYPLFLNHSLIKNNRILLVEGVSDVVSFFCCGIKETACIFGLVLHSGLINALIKLNPRKIIIATNNDDSPEQPGQKAAEKIYNQLSNYFDENVLEIRLPIGGKDINEILVNKGKEEVIRQYGK